MSSFLAGLITGVFTGVFITLLVLMIIAGAKGRESGSTDPDR